MRKARMHLFIWWTLNVELPLMHRVLMRRGQTLTGTRRLCALANRIGEALEPPGLAALAMKKRRFDLDALDLGKEAAE